MIKKTLLSVTHISYAFDRQSALFKNISFLLEEGDLLQVTGDNGRGKTTLLKILVGLLEPDSGNIQKNVSNKDCFYLPHQVPLKDHLTLEENIITFCKLKDKKENSIDQALDFIGLLDKKKQLTYQLSAGQKRRLGLAMITALKSRLLVLDEPFTALDPKGRSLTEALISHHLEKKRGVIFTSHQPIHISSIEEKKEVRL